MSNMSETMARHILSVYNHMRDNAKTIDDTLVWEGSLTTLCDELSISRTHYTPIFRVLEDGGHISRLERGGRNKPSIVLLHQAPEIDSLLLTPEHRRATLPLVRRVENIERLLGGMNVVEALRTIEDRLNSIQGTTNTQGE